ncbi:MAG: T9SS type A sorting domain-containing protein [Bacteroidetes bacterium]|nr:T9SS type A sorting domain-containing protein [Bacteroidota bacterium]
MKLKDKNKTKIFFAVAIGIGMNTNNSFSQSSSGFEKCYGDIKSNYAYSAETMNDGGYIIVGQTPSSINQYLDILVIKTDAAGTYQWNMTYGGSKSDWAYSVKQTNDGNIIITGITMSFLDTTSGNIFLMKTDTQGNILWTQEFGGASSDVPNDVISTTDGGFLITGYTTSFGTGNSDAYLIKTDSDGNAQWTKTYGGTGATVGYSALQTSDGGYKITGYSSNASAGNYDILLMKVDAIGNPLWTTVYGGTNADYAFSISPAPNEGAIISGTTWSYGNGDPDINVTLTDSGGNPLWYKVISGSGNDYGYSVVYSSPNSYMLAGKTDSYGAGSYDAFLCKLDTFGTFQWGKTYGGTHEDEIRSMKPTMDGGFLMAGGARSFTPPPNYDHEFFVIKTDSSGNSNCSNAMNTVALTIAPAIGTFTPVISAGTIVAPPPAFQSSLIFASETQACSPNFAQEENTMENTITVFPNPTNGIIEVKALSDSHNKIEIYNTLGECIHRSFTSASKSIIDISAHPQGIYFYKIISEEKNISSGKIIIQ